MLKSEERVRLQHMLDAAKKAVQLAAGRNRTDLDEDDMFPLAIVRLLEIVGEAAKSVGTEARAAVPAVPWKQVAGTRDRLIHGYHDVDMDIVWSIIVHDLPALIPALRTALADD
jgi:uncharacterized protein with HEPN domain